MNEFLKVAKDLDIKDIGMNVVDEEIEEVNVNQSFEQEVEENDYQKQTKHGQGNQPNLLRSCPPVLV